MSFIADGPGQPESEKHRMYNEYSISIVSDLSFEATLPRIKTDSGASFLKRENPSAAIFKMGCSTENLLAMRDRLIPERFQWQDVVQRTTSIEYGSRERWVTGGDRDVVQGTCIGGRLVADLLYYISPIPAQDGGFARDVVQSICPVSHPAA